MTWFRRRHLSINFRQPDQSTSELSTSLIIDALSLLPNLVSLHFHCPHHSLGFGSAPLRRALAAHPTLREFYVVHPGALETISQVSELRSWPIVARPQARLRLASDKDLIDAAGPAWTAFARGLSAFARDSSLIISHLTVMRPSADILALLPSLNLPVDSISLQSNQSYSSDDRPLICPSTAWYQQLSSLSPSIRTVSLPGHKWGAPEQGGGNRAAALAAFAPAHISSLFAASGARASVITLSDAAPRVLEYLELVLPDAEDDPEDLGLLLHSLSRCFPALSLLSITGDVTTVVSSAYTLLASSDSD